MIGVITIAQKNPAWVDAGFQDYSQRCVQPFAITHHQVALQKRIAGGEQKALEKEASQCLKLIKPTDYVIGLDPNGLVLDSHQFADKIQQTLDAGQRPLFIIGAPEGLSATIRQACHTFWSLGPLTMPHTLVKVVLAEQIFRAWSIIQQHPYHR